MTGYTYLVVLPIIILLNGTSMIYKLIIKLKRRLLIWRYKKIVCVSDSSIDYPKIILNYCQHIKRLTINKHPYRDLIKYRIFTTSDTGQDLLDKLRILSYLVNQKSHSIDMHVKYSGGRKNNRLDAWLVHNSGEALNDDVMLYAIVKSLTTLCGGLISIQNADDALFKFYTQSFHSHFIDYIEVLDALTALQLNISDADRNHNNII